MTVAFVFEIFLPTVSGVITVTTSLASELINQGHRVIFIVPRRKISPRTLPDSRITIRDIPSIPGMLYPGLRISTPFCRLTKQYLVQEQVDIVHITGPGSVAHNAIRSARQLGIPVVHTWHTMLSDPGYLRIAIPIPFMIPILQKASKYYYRPFVRNITMTAPGIVPRGFLLSLYPRLQVQLLRNGIDLSRLRTTASLEDLQKEYPLFNEKSFVFVGRMSVEKSVVTLIKAFAAATKKDTSLRLFLIGDGPQLAALKELARTLAPASVVFTGALAHEDILQKGFLQHARAFVTASTSETQSMTLIESVSAGTPAVAFDNDASVDVAHDAGILVEEGNIARFTEALLRVANDDGLWQELKKKAQRRRQAFDIRHITQELVAIYSGLRA